MRGRVWRLNKKLENPHKPNSPPSGKAGNQIHMPEQASIFLENTLPIQLGNEWQTAKELNCLALK